MPHLSYNEPRSKRINTRRDVSRDAAALMIDVDHVGVRTTAKTAPRLKQRAEDVRSSLAKSLAAGEKVITGWVAATLSEICDHAEHTDHVYLRRELSRLSGLIAAVVAAYGDSHRYMLEVQREFRACHRQALTHMFKEEHLLFSDIRRIEQTPVRPFYESGIVSGTIQIMQREHQCMRRTLRRIRMLTRDYKVPSNANDTFRDMLVGMRNLENYVRQHMQNEDDILFSRAVALENILMR